MWASAVQKGQLFQTFPHHQWKLALLQQVSAFPLNQASETISTPRWLLSPSLSTLVGSAQRERSPSPPGHNPPTPQSTDSQPALSDISATTPTAPAPTPKRRRHPDMDCISYQSQSLRRSTRNTSGGDRPAEGSSGGKPFFLHIRYKSSR